LRPFKIAAPLKPVAVIFTISEIGGKECGAHAKENVNGLP
jgi:hypothetical protein